MTEEPLRDEADRFLLEKIRDGSSDAFDRLVDRFGGRLKRIRKREAPAGGHQPSGGSSAVAREPLTAALQRAGVRFLDLEAAFTEGPLSYVARRADGSYDPHYGPRGTKAFARALYPELQAILSEKLPRASSGDRQLVSTDQRQTETH